MLQVMSAQERQIADFSSREAEVEALSRQCKEKVEEAMVARDQSISKEQMQLRISERALEEKRKDAQTRQAEIDEAVLATRQRAEAKIRGLEEQLADAAARTAQGNVEIDAVLQEKASLTAQLDRARQNCVDEKRAYDAALKGLEDRLKQAEISRNEDAVRRRDLQEQNKSLRSTVDALRSQVDSSRLQLGDKDASRDKEVIYFSVNYSDICIL